MENVTYELFKAAESELYSIISSLERLRIMRQEILKESGCEDDDRKLKNYYVRRFNIDTQILQVELILDEILPKSLRSTVKRRLTLCGRATAEAGIKQVPFEEIQREAKEMVQSFRDQDEREQEGKEGTD